jgi:hypothetical protein
VGFICEGQSDKILLESPQFGALLTSKGLRKVNVIFTQGAGNLLPQNIESFRSALKSNGAEVIFVLTDLDENLCITSTKDRLQALFEERVVVAVRAIESWFLADSQTLSILLNKQYHFERPEDEAQPFETLRSIFLNETQRGVGTKPILARRMIKYGFSLEAAAAHPNCPSARYFLDKLQKLTTEN